MLTLWAPQVESLWDESLPVEVKELPADLAELDRVLSDPELMMVVLERWCREVVETGRLVLTEGRPTIAMETYVRLMVLKARYRWGYRTLLAEVSDSIHLRRFCRISLTELVPDDSTVRKLTRRVGAEMVNELTRTLIETAAREKRFRPRPPAPNSAAATRRLGSTPAAALPCRTTPSTGSHSRRTDERAPVSRTGGHAACRNGRDGCREHQGHRPPLFA